jgi:hypothetical protein
MTFAGQKLEEVRKSWVENIFTKLTTRQNEERADTVSKRIQFMILDLIEMKSSGWSPHNKWWSPSVQRAPERERTRSSPSPPTNEPQLLVQQAVVVSPQQEQQQESQQHSTRNRSRTRSEGSGLSRASITTPPTSAPITTTQADLININTIPPYNLHQHQHRGEQQQQQQPTNRHQKINNNNNQSSQSTSQQQTRKGQRELTQHQSRALMALLNKVSPLNVDRY